MQRTTFSLQAYNTTAQLQLSCLLQQCRRCRIQLPMGCCTLALMLCNRQATESDYDTDVAPLADKYKLPK